MTPAVVRMIDPGEEGQLPEVLTKASTTMSKWERESALA